MGDAEEIIERLIIDFVRNYLRKDGGTDWRKPVVSMARIDRSFIGQLKSRSEIGREMVRKIPKPAESIVTYFVPYSEEIVKGNRKGDYSTLAFADAYIDTNELIDALNDCLLRVLKQRGHNAWLPPIPKWDVRQVAYLAGLGTIGLNNLLITSQGCAGLVGACSRL